MICQHMSHNLRDCLLLEAVTLSLLLCESNYPILILHLHHHTTFMIHHHRLAPCRLLGLTSRILAWRQCMTNQPMPAAYLI